MACMPPVKNLVFSHSCLPVAGVPSPPHHNTLVFQEKSPLQECRWWIIFTLLLALPKTVQSFSVPMTLTQAMAFVCLLGFSEEGILRIQRKLLQASNQEADSQNEEIQLTDLHAVMFDRTSG